MRIGINTFALSGRLGMAGPGRYISELASALVRVSSEHELIFFGNADNLTLLPSGGCQKIDCGRATIARPLRLLWEQLVLPILARSYHVDVLHSPTFVSPLALPCTSVVSILDMTWFTHRNQHTLVKGGYFRAMIPPSARRAARVIAISEASKQDVVDLLGIPAEQVAVTYLGVDSGVFYPHAATDVEAVLARCGVSQPYVLYVGKLEPRKNLPALIEAFDSISHIFPDHSLVIAGNPGWDYQVVYERAKQVSCRERICFTGFVSDMDLPALYSGADLFVYPSSYEGFGIPVLEAMACGTPVITSNVSSLPEVAGDAGLLVDPLDIAGLAGVMRRVLTDAELCQQMRKRGLKRAKQFTWEKAAWRTLQVYKDAYALIGRST